MTDCCVYIGDLGDPKFKWEGGDWSGNVPRWLSSEFPPMSGHYNEAFHRWVKSNGVTCEQTDFGGWVAKVKKAQLRDFIAVTYRGSEELPWVKNCLPDLLEFVATLDEGREYGLVATEY